MNLLKATGTIGGLTLLSRVLGLVRDSLFARYVGAGFASDAFLVAFRLPNMFRALFAEGAFSSAFIPMFNQKVADPEGKGLRDGLDFAEAALAVLLPVLIVMTVLLEVFAWPVTFVLSGKFNGVSADQFAYAVQLSRLTIPYLMLISVVSLFGGILNSMNKFWVNAAAPILLNVTLIVALLGFHSDDPLITARNQAIGVSVSGALQLAWLAWACRKNGVRLRLRRPCLSPEIKRLMKLILPAAAGAGAVQINLVVSTALAASLLANGSVTYIYMADRLNQLPLGLIGIGLGTVLLPTISRQLGGGEEAAAMDTQNRGMELALLLTLPATMALMLCGEPITAALFGYGKFDAQDTHYTAQALAAFSIGLPSYILVKVLTPGFYARQDTRTPVRFATISMGVNLVGNLILILPLQHMGPPLATAIASTVNVWMLYRTLVKRGHFVADARLKRRVWRLALAALAMGGVLWLGQGLVMPYVAGTWMIRLAAMAALVTSGVVVYGLATVILGAFSKDDLKLLLRRRRTN
ncbi:MAG: murein biosynthesis integral membrane protein MurJ [Novosphingobium sp. 32-60-15]|uniref:murein biosynthesis integral membrane protein MurJ n=1 Tax=unclassified Novosphingobium TaxID=2644732 RepID=UPI000BDCD103|nr:MULTISPECIES: murein biosynthesis integral membrane protein MurJ [unclassified Novosphingobium]OYX62625.1 MAG: murein biosynthesis integral membrane protein MurJ [Novosphingobium sp. 32-60-15]